MRTRSQSSQTRPETLLHAFCVAMPTPMPEPVEESVWDPHQKELEPKKDPIWLGSGCSYGATSPVKLKILEKSSTKISPYQFCNNLYKFFKAERSQFFSALAPTTLRGADL